MRFSNRLLSSSLSAIKRPSTRPVLITKTPFDEHTVRKVEQFTIKASSHHPAVKSLDTSQDTIKNSFDQLRLRNDVVEALASIKITQPTVIQTLAIPKILAGKNVLCAAETGSGKTVAYLSPLINRLREEEEKFGLCTRLRHPRALVLLHSRELANQVFAVAKSLSHIARCRVVGLTGGAKQKFIKYHLNEPIDIAVATPNALFKLQKENSINLSDVSHLVLDEADTLLDESFQEMILDIIKSVKIRQSKSPNMSIPSDAQVTIVGATLSEPMLKKLNKIIPSIKRVTSKGLHQILPHIEQRFIKVEANDKADKLLQVLREAPNKPTIVFCNSVPACDWTGRFLTSKGVELIKLHAGLDRWVRESKLVDFINGGARVLVTTDVASRGIDIPNVSRVILFDWPHNVTDYLHRVGRTGRVGMKDKCVAISFMTRQRDVRMAWEIKDAAERRKALLDKKFVE